MQNMPRVGEQGAVTVAPHIAAQVADIRRQVVRVPLTRELAHLPGARGLRAGLGNLLGWMRDGNTHLRRQVQQYGPVYRHVFGLDPAVCVADPALVARISRNEERVWSSALAWGYFMHGMDPDSAGWDGILTLDFEPHRDVRNLLRPAFNAEALKGYLAPAMEMCTRAAQEWVRRGRIAFKPEVRRLLAHLSARIFMGVDDKEEAALLDRALRDMWIASVMPGWRTMLNPIYRRALKGYRQLQARLMPRLTERRAQGGADLFSHFCRAGRQLDWADDAVLVRTFISLMLGAFDTTSLALSSMAHLLARHPSWQERLREEAQAVGTREPCLADLSRMEQTEWVWKETLRIFPVASHLLRRNLCDVELAGHHIPAGTLVFALLGPAMQDARWWSTPEAFDPARFSPTRAEDRRHRGAFLPFGAGAHACIGAQLAELQAKALWHALLTHARLQPVRDGAGRHAYRPLGAVTGLVKLRLDAL